MVSISTPSCNSPRPPISNASLPSLSLKVMATLVSASAKSLSRIIVEVTFLPSRPAKGLSLTMMVTDMVGGSIGVEATGASSPAAPIVSATEVFASPAIQMMSPACAISTGTRSVPSKRKSLVKRPCSTVLPSRLMAVTVSLTRAMPCTTRPVKHRPKNGSLSKSVASIAKGLSSGRFGAGT